MKKLSILFLTIFAVEVQAQLPGGSFANYEFTDGTLFNSAGTTGSDLTGNISSITDRNGILNAAADISEKLIGTNLGSTNITNSTLSFWIKHSNLTSSERIIQMYGTGGFGYRVEMDGSNIHVNASVESGGSFLGQTFPSPQEIDDNTWHHIAVRTEATGSNTIQEFTLFIDGQPVQLGGNATATITPGGSISNFLLNAALVIDPLDGQYSGDIDDIYLYKSALTNAEVLDIFNYTIPESRSRIYVDVDATGIEDGSNWTNAFKSLDRATDYILPGGEIWVADGIYRENTTNRDFSFAWTVDSVKLYGGFSGSETLLTERDWRVNKTILSGDIGVSGDKTDNMYTTLTGPAGEPGNTISYSLIDGITVQDGYADGTTYTNRRTGGGFYSYDYVSHTEIRNCTFQHNYSNSSGAAASVHAYFVNKTIDFENCIFQLNTSNNVATGITVRTLNNLNMNTNITNCLFKNNISTSLSPTGQPSSLFYFGATGTTSNFNINITNSTITQNQHAYNGAEEVGLFLVYTSSNGSNANVNLLNNIIWNNEGNTVLFRKHSVGTDFDELNQDNSICDLTSTLSIVSNTNVSNLDPQFVDSINDDFSIKSTSPAIDQGLSTGVNLPNVDLNGEARISGSGVDLGCYEFQSTVGVQDHEFSKSLESSTFPNPTNGLVTFSISDQIENIEVFNMNGQSLLRESFSNQINLESLNPGVYMINVKTSTKSGILKLIKQ